MRQPSIMSRIVTKIVSFSAVAVSIATFGALVAHHLSAQAVLKVSYGASGIQTVAFSGVSLEDAGQYPSDAFHIWHMSMTDLQGNPLTSGEYGWGENNNGKQWDPATQTWTYSFSWGSIAVRLTQNGNTLNMYVFTRNNANSGVIFNGASIFPLALHFPQVPQGFAQPAAPQLADNVTMPSVVAADWGTGMLAAVSDTKGPLYSGFMPTGAPNAYTALISGTTPDNLATFATQVNRPVMPGQVDSFTVCLRFAPSGTPLATLASDAYRVWESLWPPALNWTDRRIIGTVYLASSPSGNPNQPGGYANNPRRYFNDANANDFDVTTAAGLVKFQNRILGQAASVVQNLQRLNAQGVITWDIEGEQYPQSTSYVCSPDQIAAAAPEMESVIEDPGSPYVGMKLDDAYFKTIRDAGFRVGVCVRPQQFTLGANGTAAQVYLPSSQVAAELIGKMTYAYNRWGATLFYIDSTVDSNGSVLDASVFQQAAAANPNALLMPEESTDKAYAYTAPFKSFLDLGALGTDASVYGYYPKAFSVVLINDVDASKLQAAQAQLTQQVRNGDLLMVHADYWQANNPTVMAIYAAAGQSGSSAGGRQ